MEFLNTLKLDAWWKVVLWCGIALCAISLAFGIEIASRKHLFGLGIEMFLVGIANFAAIHTVVIPDKARNAIWTGKKPIHNSWKTKLPLYIGWILIACFGSLLLWSLI